MESIDHWLWEIGEAATRLIELGALEGAAGNVSLFVPRDTPGLDTLLNGRFQRAGQWRVDLDAMLPPGVLVVTGTGRRLRDAINRPETVLCALDIQADGYAWLHHALDYAVEPTSEIDSHIGVHAVGLNGRPAPHAVIHAQPPKITWLSHIPAYRDHLRLNRQLFRWQPETIVVLPEGIGTLPFEVPGTPEQGRATTEAMRQHEFVVWAKHGVVVRSPDGPLGATDLIDYVEAVARYEVDDLLAGRVADGLSLDELRAITGRFGVSADLIARLPERLLTRADTQATTRSETR